jgi:hypothetical protein
MPSNEHQHRDGPWAKVGVVVGVIGVVLTLYGLGAFSGGAGKATGTGSAGEPKATTHEPKTMTTYVESLQQTVTSTSVATGGANVGGRSYAHGLTINSLSGTEEEPRGAAFALPGQFAAFRAVVGVDPGYAPGFSGSMGVIVAAGEHDLLTTTISRGSVPCTIDVSLKGAGNVELEAYAQSGEPLKVAFGDARVVGEKDFADMPSGPPCS